MNKSLYQEFIQEHIKNKQFYNKNNNVPLNGIIINIKNNNLDNVVDGYGFVHEEIKQQYIQCSLSY